LPGLVQLPSVLDGSEVGVAGATVDISVVMPCLNEEDSVGLCVAKAWEGIRRAGLSGEVIVADNGSSDRSVLVAEAAGARVVHQPARGYGNAYLMGFSEARGDIIVMGDSDDSYDFTALPDLIGPLRRGYDCVVGSRFTGEIRRNAMTWSHRYLGNPILTAILNVLFKLSVTDAHSGFRAFTRSALDRLELQCAGMEFASEIIVNAGRAGLSVAEVPITYHPRIGESKLNSFRDAWRHLRFLLLLSPDYLFVMPGVAFSGIGFLGQLAFIRVAGGSSALAVKVLLALVTLAGSQLLTFGLIAQAHADSRGEKRNSRISGWVTRTFTLEHGLVVGLLFFALGVVLVIAEWSRGWAHIGAGGLSASLTILGLLSLVLGAELWFDAFFLTFSQLTRPGLATSSVGDRAAERPSVSALSTGMPVHDAAQLPLSLVAGAELAMAGRQFRVHQR